MRVLVTADTFSGVWTYARELVTGLVTQGAQVTLVSFGEIPLPDQTAWMQNLHGLEYHPTAFRLDWMEEGEQDFRGGPGISVRDRARHAARCAASEPAQLRRAAGAHAAGGDGARRCDYVVAHHPWKNTGTVGLAGLVSRNCSRRPEAGECCNHEHPLDARHAALRLWRHLCGTRDFAGAESDLFQSVCDEGRTGTGDRAAVGHGQTGIAADAALTPASGVHRGRG